MLLRRSGSGRRSRQEQAANSPTAAAAGPPTCSALQLGQAACTLRRGQELPCCGQQPLHSAKEVGGRRGLGFGHPACDLRRAARS